MGVADQPERRALDGKTGRHVGGTDEFPDGVAWAAMPALHADAVRRAAGLRERSHSISPSLSLGRANSVEGNPTEPGAASREGSTAPVAP
jgi:hypothetical protein